MLRARLTPEVAAVLRSLAVWASEHWISICRSSAAGADYTGKRYRIRLVPTEVTMESVRFVGMDVHKHSIQMAVLSDQRHGAEIERAAGGQ